MYKTAKTGREKGTKEASLAKVAPTERPESFFKDPGPTPFHGRRCAVDRPVSQGRTEKPRAPPPNTHARTHAVEQRDNLLDGRHRLFLGRDDGVPGVVAAAAVASVVGDELGELPPVGGLGDQVVGVGVGVDAEVSGEGWGRISPRGWRAGGGREREEGG